MKDIQKAPMSLRARNTITALALTGAGTLAGAEGVSFDTANLESTATTILGVGAAIAIGFAVFKIGKRAMNRV